jgi:hypothetical protein
MHELLAKEIDFSTSQLYDAYVNVITHDGEVCEGCLMKLLISLSVALTQLAENHCEFSEFKNEILQGIPPLDKITNLH